MSPTSFASNNLFSKEAILAQTNASTSRPLEEPPTVQQIDQSKDVKNEQEEFFPLPPEFGEISRHIPPSANQTAASTGSAALSNAFASFSFQPIARPNESVRSRALPLNTPIQSESPRAPSKQ